MRNKKSKYKLTISLLVSNSINTIEKCLDSLSPLLRQISSELIIIDTVGKKDSDGSLEIAKRYTDKIIHFDWCNDFAAARNKGLKLAQGEWFMFIDDDEWFDDVGELIDFFRDDDENKKYFSLTYDIHNYNNRNGKSYYVSVATRCVKLNSDIKFINKIHEQLAPIYIPSKQTKVFAHHYGYVSEKNDEKVKRNEEIIEKVLKDNPQDMHMWTQLLGGFSKSSKSDLLKIKNTANKALQEFKKIDNKTEGDYFSVEIILDFLFLYFMKEKEWTEVLNLKETIETTISLSEYECCVSDFFVYQALINLNRFEDAREHVHSYSKNLKWLQEHEQEWLHQQSFYFESYVSEDKLFAMASTMAQYDKANENWQKIILDTYKLSWKINNEILYNYLPIIFEALYHEKDYKTFQYICNQLEDENGKLPIAFGISAVKVKKLAKVDQYKFTEMISKLDTLNDPFVMVQRALKFEKSSLKRHIEKLKKEEVSVTIPYGELLPLLVRNAINPSAFVESVSYDDWVSVINQIVELYEEKKDEIPSFLMQIEENWEDGLKRSMLLMALRHKYLFSQDVTISMVKKEIKEYALDVTSFANSIYNREILFKNSSAMLPGEVRFGLFLREAIEERQGGHIERYFAKLHQGLNAYKEANHLVELLLEEYSEEESKQQRVMDEMRELGSQVKVRVLELIQRGNFEQAKSLALELSDLLPDDLEVKELLHLCDEKSK
ncbi:MAG: glycosyltransferase [Liquorilactobacillus hordei]|uniref:glycosyltransferase n=1 Tax=Liquorilactobacillus hordei TaxID=468911 RepID=UPI0039EC8E19